MVNLHAILRRSRANGPGTRLVVWFQGCSLGCPGCFNPETHSPAPREVMPVADVVERIVSEEHEIEGISVSGGEPLQQPEALLALLSALRERTRLSVILFSGYTLAQIRRMPLGPDILGRVDVLIAGRYVRTRRLSEGLRGSSNQQIHLLTERYTLAEVEATPPGEVVIDAEGNVVISGVWPPDAE